MTFCIDSIQTAMAASRDIVVDRGSGRVENASAWEGMLIRLIRMSHLALRPLQEFGISRVAGLIGRCFAAERHVRVRLNGDSWFRFPASDYYWPMLYSPWIPYEPDIGQCLQELRQVDYVFVDCGANYGYWTILATSAALGGKRAIAIEASPGTCRVLEQNAALNGGRFQTLQCALSDCSGQRTVIYGCRHAGRTLVKSRAPDSRVEHVETATIDDAIMGWMPEAFAGRVVLKLDIEGMERAAVSGAPKLMKSDVLVIFEDSEPDRISAVVPLLLDDLGMRIFAHRDGRFLECSSVERVAALKARGRWGRLLGYNFFATRSAFWLDRLIGATPLPPAASDGDRVAN